MNQDILKRMFWACCGVDSYIADASLDLGTLYERNQDGETMVSRISNLATDSFHLGVEQVNELDTLVSEATSTFEEQGFINGFRMAVKLILATQ